MRPLLLALGFLTRIPVPSAGDVAAKEMARSVPFFPVVGGLIGLMLVGVDAAMSPRIPPLAVDVLVLAAAALLTGGMHLDGLMDSADGLFGGNSPERRLDIMRDSRVGSYGVQAGVLVMLLKLGLLSGFHPGTRLGLLLAFPACGRWTMTAVMGYHPYARPGGGLGRAFTGETGPGYRALAALSLLGVLVLAQTLGLPLGQSLWAAAAAAVAARWLAQRSVALVGGMTGDVFGAINEVGEVIFLLFVNFIQ